MDSSKPTSKKKPGAAEQVERPDVEVHDEIYFRSAAGPLEGRVVSTGAHGAHVSVRGRKKPEKVRWEHVLGTKVKVRPDVKVVSQGQDGMIVEDPRGLRRYVHDPVGEDAPPVAKALVEPPAPAPYVGPRLLLRCSPEAFYKAMGAAGRQGLREKQLTDKNGHQTKRWVRGEQKPSGAGRPAREDGPPEAGADHGFGTHNLEAGDKVKFTAGDFSGEGEIVGKPGKDGFYAKDAQGRQHQVRWSEVTGHAAGSKGAARSPEKPGRTASADGGGGEALQPEEDAEGFSGAAYAAKHNDASATPESILAQFPPDTADKIKAVQERLSSIEQTIDQHKESGEYTDQRIAVHAKIVASILSPAHVEAATPAAGEKPTFTMLGGRGGSGKSALKGRVYDDAKAIVLDADEIKGMLPEYEGWNAHQVHEESSELLEAIMGEARDLGLNVVLDATMKSAKGALEKVDAFKGAGYRIEAHYMHLPRQEAAKRAVGRFLGKTQRYVPPEVVLANKDNEKTFDEVRKHADAWSFHDNNVPKGHEPKLIARSEGLNIQSPRRKDES